MADFDPYNLQQYGLQGYNDQGSSGSDEGAISHFLDLFNRPHYAMLNLLKGKDPMQGLLGNERPSWADPELLGDYLGVKPDDDTLTAAAKHVGAFAADAILNPINLVPMGAVGKALGAAGKGVASVIPAAAPFTTAEGLAKLYAGSGFFKRFGRMLPGEGYAPVEESIMAMQREGNRTYYDALAAKQKAQEIIGPILDKIAKDTLDAGGSASDVARAQAQFQHAYETGAAIPEQFNGVMEALQPLFDIYGSRRGVLNSLLPEFGEKPLADVTGINWMPQQWTQQASRQAGNRFGDVSYNTDPSQFSRELMRWRNPETGELILDANGNPLISKGLAKENPNIPYSTGLDPETGFGTYAYQGKPVLREQASLLEKMGATDPTQWNTNPVDTLFNAIQDVHGKASYLEMIKGLTDSGAVVPMEQAIFGNVPTYGIGGLKGYAATDKGIANRLQNLAQNSFPELSGGRPWDADLLNRFANSGLGQAAREFLNWWRPNQLALHPGYHAANAISDMGLLNQAGVPWYRLPGDLMEASAIRRQVPGQVFEGLENADLAKEMAIRGAGTGSYYGPVLDAAMANKDPRTAERVSGVLSALGIPESAGGAVGDAAQAIASKWGDLNRWGMQAGAGGESTRKLAAVVDWLKQNAPDVGKMAPAEQAKILDKAAMYANDAMFFGGRGNIPEYERNLQLLVPFENWTRGILGKTAEVAATSPQKFARTELALRQMFDPLDSASYESASPDIKEGMPVTGIKGLGSLDSIAAALGADPLRFGGQRMMQLARFLPWGTVEQFTNRPVDAAVASVSPNMKAIYELLANKDTYHDREIDPIAGAFPFNLTSPALGTLTGNRLGGMYSPASETWFGGYNPSAGAAYVMSQSPLGRYWRELQTMGAGTLWENDPYKQPLSLPEKALWYATGGKFAPFDESKQLNQRMQEFNKLQGAAKGGMKYAAGRGADIDQWLSDLIRIQTRGPKGVIPQTGMLEYPGMP